MSIYTRLKVEQLRVGNLIWNIYFGRAEKLSLAGYTSLVTTASNAQQLRAIKLSPGWCEQMGGDYIGNEDGTMYAFKNDSVAIHVYFVQHMAFILLGEAKIEIPHVHMLQNIYFFLTGNELSLAPIPYKDSQ